MTLQWPRDQRFHTGRRVLRSISGFGGRRGEFVRLLEGGVSLLT